MGANTKSCPENGAAGPAAANGFGQLPRRQALRAMACIMLAMLLAALSQTVIVTAMPRIVVDLGGFDRYAWASTAYFMAATVVAPIVGGLTDIFGRKPFFVVGITVFVLGSVLAGFSVSMDQLIAFRAIQGIGGGTVMISSLVAIADLFPPEKRGRFQGLIAVVYAVAAVVGPTLGGLITDSISWNWIFLFNVPLGILVLLLIARTFPNFAPKNRNHDLDYPGMATLVLAIASIVPALSMGGVRFPWASPQIIGLLAFGTTMAGAFVLIETRSRSPVFPLSIYGDPVIAISDIVSLLLGFGLYGSLLFLPLLLQGVHGASATGSGTILSHMILGIMIGAIVSGRLLSVAGGHFRVQAIIGTALMTAGMFLISELDGNTSLLWIKTCIVLSGLGLGATLAVFGQAAQNAVPFRLVGVATSAIHFFRSLGGVLGVAVLGVVLTTGFSSRLDEAVDDEGGDLLSGDLLDALKENPQEMFYPDASDRLRESLIETGPDGAGAASLLLATLDRALVGAVQDVFVVAAAFMALAFGLALFFRGPGEAANLPESGKQA